MTQMVKKDTAALAAVPAQTSLATSKTPISDALRPTTLKELLWLCESISKSSVCPKNMRGDTMAIVVCAQAGEQFGFNLLQSLQLINVINGKWSMSGDGMLAVCQAHHAWGGDKLERGGSWANKDAWVLYRVWRKGNEAHPIEQRFSYEDAARAKLIGKSGPWQEYPERMMMYRARGFALRDCFADKVNGIITTEEAEDYPTFDHQGNPAPRVTGPVKDAGEPIAQVTAPAAPDPARVAEAQDMLKGADTWAQFIAAESALTELALVKDSPVHRECVAVYSEARERLKARNREAFKTCESRAEWLGVSNDYRNAPQAVKDELLPEYNAGEQRVQQLNDQEEADAQSWDDAR